MVVLIPVYDDWVFAGLLLKKLDNVLVGILVSVMFTDDGSPAGPALQLRSPLRHVSMDGYWSFIVRTHYEFAERTVLTDHTSADCDATCYLIVPPIDQG